MNDIDFGVRCDRHTGEAFRVRCYDCDALAAEAALTAHASARGGYLVGTECPLHENYLLPCDRCLRDKIEGATL